MDIKIEKYIEDYENRRITVSEIAEKENASISTISSKIKKYYNLRREQKLKTVKKSKSDLIEKYIEDLENGKITPKELAEKLLVSQSSINMLIREFYKQSQSTDGLQNKLIRLIKAGYTETQIREEAKKRNMIISDEDLKKAREALIKKNDKSEREDDEISM